MYSDNIQKMKRRIIKQGHNALTITLPAKWVNRVNLKAGNEVEVKEKDNSLMIETEANVEPQRKIIELKNSAQYLQHYPNNIFLRSIDVNYRLGYDEIKLIFDDPHVMDFIEEELEFLLGFEIVDQGENYCVLKSVASSLDIEFDTILRRTFLMLISMLGDSYDAVKNGEFSRLKSVSKLEKLNNRFTNFCERHLNKKGYTEYRKTIIIYSMITLLEHIADSCNGICLYFQDMKNGSVKISNKTLKFYKNTLDMMKSFYELFYKFDRAKLCRLISYRHHVLDNESLRLFETQPKTEMLLIHHLTKMTTDMYHLADALEEPSP